MDARTETARRKVRRAAGLLREATQDLAAVTANEDVFGVLRVDYEGLENSRGAVHDLIDLGLAQYGAVEVVVIARPSRRGTPTTAGRPAKESTNGSQRTHAAAQR